MLYWGTHTYDTKGITDIKGWIGKWIAKGWRESEIILTYQSHSAANSIKGPEILNNLAAMLVGKEPDDIPPDPTPSDPTPSGSSTRCGINWSDANNNCHESCVTRDDCPEKYGSNGCYANLSMDSCNNKS